MTFHSYQVDNSLVVVRKKKRIGVELHDVAGAAVDGAALEKTGDEIFEPFALSHKHDLVSVADGFVGRTVECNYECVFQNR